MTQEIITQISETVGTEVFGIWFLIGAAFVFFMQAGFAMVETGFTRAKNAGNIIMKNLMDFCIGTVVFIFLGFGLLLGEDALGGFIGLPTLGIFTDYANFDWSNFVFNLVFCATAATIVSGAMAERTKFLSYCIYSGVISAVVYPIEAHWIWGGGWLAQMGFHDFAGSAAIHTACFYLYDNHDRTGSSNGGLHDLYMAKIWKTGCIDVPECITCRTGSNHSSLRCNRCTWSLDHWSCFRCTCSFWCMVL